MILQSPFEGSYMSPIGGFLCLIRRQPVDFNCIFIDSFQDDWMIPTLIFIVYLKSRIKLLFRNSNLMTDRTDHFMFTLMVFLRPNKVSNWWCLYLYVCASIWQIIFIVHPAEWVSQVYTFYKGHLWENILGSIGSNNQYIWLRYKTAQLYFLLERTDQWIFLVYWRVALIFADFPTGSRS